ncbi:hypothetical protein QLX08_007105 [Tetragonisca angustula]|uniref:EMI domain-containing protein n=1 Tax=Tetragonisca angustula TaxID=166442 RepID=A0AAW0ZSW3_9HYME
MSDSKIWQVVLSLIISFSKVFSADNVCSRLENYTVTSMETYTEPVVVNTFTWCLQIPPRCPKTRTEMRQRYRVKPILNGQCVYYLFIDRHSTAPQNNSRMPFVSNGKQLAIDKIVHRITIVFIKDFN